MSRLFEVREEKGEGDDDQNEVEPEGSDAHHVDEDRGHGDGRHGVAAVVDDHAEGR